MSKKENALFWDTAHRYLDHQLKVIRQVSSNTIDSYRDSLNNFIDYLEQVEQIDPCIPRVCGAGISLGNADLHRCMHHSGG